jgi:hypothetical protein
MMLDSLGLGISIMSDHKADQTSDLLLLMISALLLMAITDLIAAGEAEHLQSHPPGVEGITLQKK